MNDKTFLSNFLIRLLLCIAFVTMMGFSIKSRAQNADEPFMCSYYGEAISPQITLSEADDSAHEIIEKILSVVGLRPNFEVRAANVPNAAAVILKNKRYILYNPKFIKQINYASGTNWAGISIIAHEIGHHLNGHTLQSGGSRPNLELEADEFSGFVLHKLGADKPAAQAAMNVAASQKSSHTHPARKERLVAISDGWEQAGGITKSSIAQSTKAEQPAMVEIPVPNRSSTLGGSRNEDVLDENQIAFDVYFNSDAEGEYFITQEGELVNVDGDDNVYTVGRLSESNRSGYRLMLSDKQYNYLYIAPRGQLVNDYGKSVGYIDTHK